MSLSMTYKFLHDRKGQSTVEFSFVLIMVIVLFSMLLGLVQIAYNWMALQYAASEASRFGSLGKVDAGMPSREASITNRVNQITTNLGLSDVQVQFVDEAGGSTAGRSSEYYTLRLTRTIQLQGLPAVFLDWIGMAIDDAPIYQVRATTVIRNEPF